MNLYRRKGVFHAEQFTGPESIRASLRKRPPLPNGAEWREAYGKPDVLLPCVVYQDGYPQMLKVGWWVLCDTETGVAIVKTAKEFDAEFELIEEARP